jgi:DNA (cytosine-5)-methyltransferase 1
VFETSGSGRTQESQQLAFLNSLKAMGPSGREVYGDDHAYLRGRASAPPRVTADTVRVADLFSGCGGLTLGVRAAAEDLGMGFQAVLAVDSDPVALACYAANFGGVSAHQEGIETLFCGRLGNPLSEGEAALAEATGGVDILLGGPPCQGHSDLNNSTRRADPKNSLYLIMARAAEVLRPSHVIVENVVGAVHDRSRVVQTTREWLEVLGYRTSLGVVDLAVIGVPQTRRRLLLIASRTQSVDVGGLQRGYGTEPRDLRWAIGDLVDVPRTRLLDQVAAPATDTRARMEYLFTHDVYELPDELRPACHRDKQHTYRSIYGRLRWDRPAQTITRGFYSMCMGRYVHPERARTLTAHEAARLQFFPDSFDFGAVTSRTALARMIGNAVPMKLSYVAALELLADGIER